VSCVELNSDGYAAFRDMLPIYGKLEIIRNRRNSENDLKRGSLNFARIAHVKARNILRITLNRSISSIKNSLIDKLAIMIFFYKFLSV